MARESRQQIALPSSSGGGTYVPRSGQPCKFGTVVLALWPVKPALHLSQLADCSERHANLLIQGKRKPNARAALAIYAEIIS